MIFAQPAQTEFGNKQYLSNIFLQNKNKHIFAKQKTEAIPLMPNLKTALKYFEHHFLFLNK